jgi:hypothetical protein
VFESDDLFVAEGASFAPIAPPAAAPPDAPDERAFNPAGSLNIFLECSSKAYELWMNFTRVI